MSEAKLHLRQYEDLETDGWLSGDKGVGNGSRVREDFEVDERLSSPDFDFSSDDPAKLDESLEATFNPEGRFEG
jgi:hypothetical protein